MMLIIRDNMKGDHHSLNGQLGPVHTQRGIRWGFIKILGSESPKWVKMRYKHASYVPSVPRSHVDDNNKLECIDA